MAAALPLMASLATADAAPQGQACQVAILSKSSVAKEVSQLLQADRYIFLRVLLNFLA